MSGEDTNHSGAEVAAQNEDPTYNAQAFHHALSFLNQVKKQFLEQPHVYAAFLETLASFKDGRLDNRMVAERVYDLFQGHPALIEGFNTFLPFEDQAAPPEPNSVVVTTPATATTHDEGDAQGAFTKRMGPKVMSKL